MQLLMPHRLDERLLPQRLHAGLCPTAAQVRPQACLKLKNANESKTFQLS
jgi:hypothetical protein